MNSTNTVRLFYAMTNSDEANRPSPIEIRLSQTNIEVTCLVVAEDERTDYIPVDSVSMRGAQREISGWLIAQGYRPLDRWEDEDVPEDFQGAETVRHFRYGQARVEAA